MATDRHCLDERVVRPGLHFASRISHYSYPLSCAVKDEYNVGALISRPLLYSASWMGSCGVGA